MYFDVCTDEAGFGTVTCKEYFGSGFLAEPLFIFLWRVFRLLLWFLFALVQLVVVVVGLVVDFIASIQTFFLYIFLPTFFFFWVYYGYPTWAPIVRDDVVPILQAVLDLTQFFWNLFVILWNVAVRVWNALVPLIGMLLYIVYALFITICNEVVNILGSVDVWALFQPLMGILDAVTQVIVAVIQAVVSLLKSVLYILAKIVGALIHVVAETIKVLFPIVSWLLKVLYFVLYPILEIVVAIVQFFTRLFHLGGMRRLLDVSIEYEPAPPGFDPESLGAQSPYDAHQEEMYAAVTQASRRYMTQGDLDFRKVELSHIADYLHDLPQHSFSYYWTISHLQASSIGDYPTADEVYLGEEGVRGDVLAEASRRKLLAEGEERELRAGDELLRLWDDDEAYRREREEYWKDYDRDPDGCHRRWAHKHYERSRRALDHLGKYRRLHRRVLEAERLEQDEYDRAEVARRRLLAVNDSAPEPERPRRVANVHPFSGELERQVMCRSPLCGGHGKPLPHPVHALRRRMLERDLKQRADHRRRLPRTRAEALKLERRQKDDFVLLSTLAAAGAAARDELFDHLQSEAFAKAARLSWESIVGRDFDVGAFAERAALRYADGYELVYDLVGDLGAAGPLKALQDKHSVESRGGRRWFSQWAAANRIQRATHPKTGRQLSYVEMEQVVEEAPGGGTMRKLRSLDGEAVPIEHVRSGRRLLANVPLFQLLAETDCYTTDPSNPLCLPEIPSAAFWTGPAPIIVWPANATGGNECNYLFCPAPRDLSNVETYASRLFHFL